MAELELPDDAPATALFPQFESQLYHMISTEVDDLTDTQLDFDSDKWEWSKWSIRRNLSHMAGGQFRWLLLRWGQQLFPEGLPYEEDLDSLISPSQYRGLDETHYWELDAILAKLRQSLELSHRVLSKETVGSLRTKEIKTDNTPQWQWFSQAHPRGMRADSEDPSQGYITLEATFRHRYFEFTTHLYNIQRLKRAQGLTSKVEIPFVGYWALPGWDRSEP